MKGSMERVQRGGPWSMDRVHRDGPWTWGPCFVYVPFEASIFRHNRGVGNLSWSVKVNASLTLKVWQKDFHNVSSFSVTFIIVLFRGNTIRGTFVLQYCLVEQSRRCRMTSTSTPEDSLQSHVKGLEFLKEIGKGSYGIVYRAKWNGEEVAAKRFHPIFFENGFCEENLIDFQRERAVLEKTNHPNIVKLKTVLLPKGAPL